MLLFVEYTLETNRRWRTRKLTIFELLAVFTAVYVIRYIFDPKYKQRKKKWVVSDILMTALLAVVVQEMYIFFFS